MRNTTSNQVSQLYYLRLSPAALAHISDRPAWRAAVLETGAALKRHFDASDCIPVHDCHAIMHAFRQNLTAVPGLPGG